jgi:sugar phosphate isomerase/epimerase
MKIDQVALQTYTIRDALKTPADIAASLKKTREIGYRAIQVSGMGPIDEKELVVIAEGEGLTICATHEPAETILDEPERVVERLGKLNCTITAYPFPKGVDFGSAEAVDSLIEKLNRAGKVLHEAGLILAYHNHNHEFRKIEGRTVFERIFEKTDPRYLQGEVDTYWVQYGGASPLDWCRKLAGRLPILHLKDYRVNDDLKPEFAEIGHGNIDFKPIVAACDEGGCQWYAVEQDTCPGDPFDSARRSFEFIREHLCEK